MRIKEQILFMTIFLCTGLFSCNTEDKYLYDLRKSPYFVETYIAADDFELKELVGIENYIIEIFFKGKQFSIHSPDTKEKFKEIAKSFGDGSYTKTVLPYANKALTEALTSVTILCDKEYDPEHTIGSNLNNLVMFCATSPYDFINSGYKNYVKFSDYPDYWKVMVMNQDMGYKPVEMLVNMVNKNNSVMLFPSCHLYFLKHPAKSGKYTFTVTVKIGDREITKRIAHHF